MAISKSDKALYQQRKNEIVNEIIVLQEQISSNSSAMSRKYRSFGDEVIKVDPAMATKFYSMADNLDANEVTNQLKANKAENDMATAGLYKIQSAINSARRAHSMYIQSGQTDLAGDIEVLIASFEREQRSDKPDLARAYKLANTEGVTPESISKLKTDIEFIVTEDEVDDADDAMINSTDTFNFNKQIRGLFQGVLRSDPELGELDPSHGGYKDKTDIVFALKNAIDGAGGNSKRYKDSIADYVNSKDTALRDADKGAEEQASYNVEQARKSDSLTAQRLNNYIEARAGKGADTESTVLRKAVNKMRNATASGNSYVTMKSALGDAISGDDFAGMANFSGFEGVLSKLKEVVGNNPVGEVKSEELINQFSDSFNSMVNTYNDDLRTKLYNESIGGYDKATADKAYNRLKVNKLKPVKINSSSKEDKPSRKDYAKLSDWVSAMKQWKKGK